MGTHGSPDVVRGSDSTSSDPTSVRGSASPWHARACKWSGIPLRNMSGNVCSPAQRGGDFFWLFFFWPLFFLVVVCLEPVTAGDGLQGDRQEEGAEMCYIHVSN